MVENSCESGAESDTSSTVPILMNLPVLKSNNLSSERTAKQQTYFTSGSDIPYQSEGDEENLEKKVKYKKVP